jgi:quercetin dioxygenase-like cupin family protein
MTYVLQGALRCRVGSDEIVVRAGEVLHVPAGRRHQAEALEDTFEIDVFSPVRDDWLDPSGADPPSPPSPPSRRE